MMRLLSLLLGFVLFSCSGGSSDKDRDFYNLAFSEDRQLDEFCWIIQSNNDARSNGVVWKKDPELGRKVFCLEEGVSADGKRWPLDVTLMQQLPLFRSYDSARVRINAREKHLEDAWFKVYLLDAGERIVRRDSVPIGGGEWKNYDIAVQLRDVQYILISISSRSNPDKGLPDAALMISGVDVRLDGQPLDAGSGAPGAPQLDQARICPLALDDDSQVGGIALFADTPRVVGLGEMMSGSLSLGKAKNQIIRWLVKNRGCRLVMVEFPGVPVLKWDLYIQGFAVDLRGIMEDLAGTGVVREEIDGLLRFLREYNRTTARKVHIVGIDRSAAIGYAPLIFDYLYVNYLRCPDDCVRRLIRDFYQPDSVYSILTGSREEVIRSIGSFEYEWFKKVYGFKVSEQGIPGVQERGAENCRDYIMWLHIQSALAAAKLRTDECAVYSGHWFRVNKLNLLGCRTPSVGNHLAERYDSGYRALALLSGEGRLCALRIRQRRYDSTCILPPPRENLIEGQAMKTGLPYFYYPADALPQTPVNVRYVPFFYEKMGTEACNLPGRVDGLVFVRDCECADIPWRYRRMDAFHSAGVVDRRMQRMIKCGKRMGIDFNKAMEVVGDSLK